MLGNATTRTFSWGEPHPQTVHQRVLAIYPRSSRIMPLNFLFVKVGDKRIGMQRRKGVRRRLCSISGVKVNGVPFGMVGSNARVKFEMYLTVGGLAGVLKLDIYLTSMFWMNSRWWIRPHKRNPFSTSPPVLEVLRMGTGKVMLYPKQMAQL
jgi:hypothetical protein